MVELTFDQLSPEEKEDVVSFYNSQRMNTGSPLTEATLPPPPVTATRNRSWRDMVVATEDATETGTAPSESLRPVDVGNDTVADVGNVFRQGDRDAGPNGDIRAAQTVLSRLGTSVGEVDGVYGRNTMNAVQEGQEILGLPRTGVLDQATQDAFNNLTDSQIDFYNSESEAIAEDETETEAVTETAEQDEGVTDQPTDTPSRDELIDSVFRAEGGYSNDRGDTGNYYNGIFIGTNHGISAPVLAEHLGRTPSVQDMRNLTQDEAREIAATNYYDRYFIDLLPAETREIVFHAVYMGGSRGIRAVQSLTGQTPDGQMGPATRRGMRNATFTPAEFRDEYLRELEFGTEGYSSPAATWDRHGRGWTNRYNDLSGD